MSCHPNPNEALLWALLEMDESGVKKALKDGANANLLSPTNSRPLHAAALRGSASIVKILVKHKAEVDQADSEGFTPLMVAALNGRTGAVETLLASGAEPKLGSLDDGETALHLAMNGGSEEVVLALLRAGADINAQTTKDKFTPLHYAAQFDAKNMAKVLLSDPLCEPETKDSKGRTATEVAKEERHHRLAEHLGLYTAAKSDHDKKLVSAVMKLEEEAARKALEAGANANLPSPTGSRPLHAAALRGSAMIINMLMEHRAAVNQTDLEGFTPLMVAALNGRTDAVKALLANHADPKLTRMNTGETALHMAMKGGSPEVVRALLGAGVDINAQTTEDKFTPLHYAAEFDAKDLADILEKDPHCDREITDSKQRTAAQLAQERGHGKRMTPDITDGSMVKVRVTIPERPVPPSERVYKVTSEPRGRVLILNYVDFERSKYREGGERDTYMLRNLFEEMGYDVTERSDLYNDETWVALKSFSNSEELKKVDCAVVCVLTHGMNRNTFITSDDTEMTVEEVYAYFTDDQCPSLKGKPKLFLFNFCRGEQIEAGCILDKNGSMKGDAVPIKETKGVDAEKKKVVLKDQVSLYASVEGVSALRNPDMGTFFVQTISRVFAELAHCLDVAELAMKVNEHMTKQMRGTTTDTNSTLMKKFYLNPMKK